MNVDLRRTWNEAACIVHVEEELRDHMRDQPYVENNIGKDLQEMGPEDMD
jgi:hypothetical protein